MSLAVADKNNQPQSHMMAFAIDKDFTIYFLTSQHANKYQILKDNKKVGISVWSDQEMLVQIQATTVELHGKQAENAIEKIAQAVTDLPNFWSPLLQIQKKSYAVFKAKPKSIRALNLSIKTMTSSQNLFTKIELKDA
jgi:nitroimidazol reductase NimA-like FMN-containing flavoprotein (pyridoxamine 5'-phosphate oxidase superfamily)